MFGFCVLEVAIKRINLKGLNLHFSPSITFHTNSVWQETNDLVGVDLSPFVVASKGFNLT